MKRIVISLVVGVTLTVGSPTVVALSLSHGNIDAIIPFLLYWPLSITDKLGFGNCANADLIADKLSCIVMALLIDLVFYPLAIFLCSYIIHGILFRRSRSLGLSHVG